jgi:aspartate/methionine/tyrosine aminotransferase
LSAPNWTLTEQALAAAFSPKTKVILLNSPMNPAGKVFLRAELELLATFLKRFDALAICDEVYEHLTFDGLKHTPLATYPGMYERCVRVGSAGKIFSLTGWKVGWVTGPSELIGAVSKAHQFITFTTPTALQIAVAHGLNNFEDYYLNLAKELGGNRDYLARELAAIGFEPLKAQGTYFLTTDIAKLRFNGSDVDFCKHMTEHARVAAIPLSVFFTGDAPQTLVRFAFCKQRAVLEDAVRRLGTHFKRN